MSTYIAFLRAVNVGGRSVPMGTLRDCLTSAGFTDVETYIQSGNVRVGSRARSGAKVEEKLEKVMAEALGFDVPAIVRIPRELVATVESAPPSPLGDEARHYLAFLRSEPSAAAAKDLNGWDEDGERLTLVGRDLHLWFTKPSHEAKATNARLEKIAGTAATSRGWKVVSALAAKWGESGST
jgi:uncharacterized protein (DUF1697 family)